MAASSSSIGDRNEKNLVVSFIQMIRHKVSANQCTDDQIEGLEVAVQCLEVAFGLSDADYAFQPSKPLIDIFRSAEGLAHGESELPEPEITDAEKEQACQLKEAGNELMKAGRADDAVQKYNEAIELHLDPSYFCDRAAAYCKLDQHDLAIQDCRTALALDSGYSRAYGRMGLALSCQKRYRQAVGAYKKALELEPEQESYKKKLKIAEEKVRREQEQNSRGGGGPPGFGATGAGGGQPIGIDAALNNPAMMNMATLLMSDPTIENMMQDLVTEDMMDSAMNQPGGLMQAGQQLAQRMRQQNPDLVNQLRQMFSRPPGDGQNPGAGGNNKPPGPDGSK